MTAVARDAVRPPARSGHAGSPVRSGRRPGGGGTREAILAAAREVFAERGYDGATMRAIAERAAVDPALVYHYFGAKERLFEAVLTLPVRPVLFLPEVLRGDPATIGERLVLAFLRTWEDADQVEVFLALVRSAFTSATAAAAIRRLLTREILEPVAATFGAENAALRATAAASQFVGLMMVRYIARLEPLASADAQTMAALFGPTLQRYLVDPLPAAAASR
jgi:AcrR family transcriptional regulator